jgi:PAS domain S-box-containing protein
LNSININKGTQLTSALSSSIFEFIFKNRFPLSKEKYKELLDQLERLLYVPLRIMSMLVALFGSVAMIFEVKYFPAHSLDIYFIRLTSTLIAFIILASSSRGTSVRRSVLLIHVLLLTIIISSGMMIYIIPTTILVNSSIIGLMIFSSALFLSWEVKHQIIVAIYYNLVFAASILFNNNNIYFLPNMTESVIFVLILSLVSILACAVNFRMRIYLAEKNLQIEQSDNNYRSIIDNSLEGIFQSTIDGTLLTINKTFIQILGYSDISEVMKLNIKELYVDEADRNNLIKEILENEKVENYRVKLKRKDGSIAIVRLNDRLIKDVNGNVYFEGNIYDITNQVKIEEEKQLVAKMLQQEKEKNEKLAREAIRISGTKSKFMANLSHEIRTPINGILGFLSLIEASAYSNEDELKFFSTNARQSAESLLDIINSILDISKIEAGKAKVEDVRFNLMNVIDQSISVVSIKANEKNIRIVKEIPELKDAQLVGDMVKLRQIMINLLNNAVKFTSDGEIRISSKITPTDNNGVELFVSVTDTGIGIPESKITDLFKPYSQLGDFYESFAHGSGLGLVICKEYVELLGGKISVDSTEGEGSSFSFTINCKLQTDLDSITEGQTERETFETQFLGGIENFSGNGFKKKREKYKILLAEDNLINQKVTIKILHTFGFNVFAVNDGMEAITAVTNDTFDLVLMDIQMPNVDGFEATEKIRSLPSSKRDIPIIALTAHALMGDKEKCLTAGMTDYLSKPISGQELAKKIDRLLDIRKDDVQHKEVPVKANSPLLDKIRLKNVSLGDYEFEKDLLSSYVTDLEQKYKKLVELTTDHDMGEIIKIAHSIKGSSYSLGAVKVADEAYAIELSGKNNDWLNVNARIDKFSKLIEETSLEIENYLNHKTVKPSV